MARELLIIRIVSIRAASTNAGRSAQKTGPKSRSKPGHPPIGKPIHEASTTRSTS